MITVWFLLGVFALTAIGMKVVEREQRKIDNEPAVTSWQPGEPLPPYVPLPVHDAWGEAV